MIEGPLIAAPSLRVPAWALRWRAVRASGPGGQNVNKVASKVELRVALAVIEGLTERCSARLR
ncbi:MAG TPA: peptide chain release factor-like protein, partial [Nannocystis sp.]